MVISIGKGYYDAVQDQRYASEAQYRAEMEQQRFIADQLKIQYYAKEQYERLANGMYPSAPPQGISAGMQNANTQNQDSSTHRAAHKQAAKIAERRKQILGLLP